MSGRLWLGVATLYHLLHTMERDQPELFAALRDALSTEHAAAR